MSVEIAYTTHTSKRVKISWFLSAAKANAFIGTLRGPYDGMFEIKEWRVIPEPTLPPKFRPEDVAQEWAPFESPYGNFTERDLFIFRTAVAEVLNRQEAEPADTKTIESVIDFVWDDAGWINRVREILGSERLEKIRNAIPE